MSYRVGTPNYNLPQTEGTDKRDWSDTNQAFLAIDTAIKNAVDTSASASSAASTAQQTADSANTAASHAQTDATTAQTLATSASELATTAKNRADAAYTLADSLGDWEDITSSTNMNYSNDELRVFKNSNLKMLKLSGTITQAVANNSVIVTFPTLSCARQIAGYISSPTMGGRLLCSSNETGLRVIVQYNTDNPPSAFNFDALVILN